MIGRISKYAFVLAGLLASCYTSAQTTPPSSKDVTEVVISGQQNASDWFRAESQHFIVYSDAKQQDVSQLLDKLERFDYLLRLYTKVDATTVSDEKITLYYMANVRDLNQIEKNQPRYAIGLYNSCALGVQGFGAHMYYRVNPDRALEKQAEKKGLPTFLKPTLATSSTVIPTCVHPLGILMALRNILPAHVLATPKRLSG
jgi:hypothetical protein